MLPLTGRLILMPMSLTESSGRQRVLRVQVQSLLERIERSLEISRFRVVLQKASTAEVKIIGGGLGRSFREKGLLVVSRFRPQLDPEKADDAFHQPVLEGEQAFCLVYSNGIGMDLPSGGCVHQTVTDTDPMIRL